MDEQELKDLSDVIWQRKRQRLAQIRAAERAERAGKKHLSWHLRSIIVDINRQIASDERIYDQNLGF